MFDDKMWDEMVEGVATSLQLSAADRNRIRDAKATKLIGSLPFLAGCDDPDRTAYLHLSAVVLDMFEIKLGGKKVFDCRASDDTNVFRRLWAIGNFMGGDRNVLERGMNLLALAMTCGYEANAAKDTGNGEYNPFSKEPSKTYFAKEKERLTAHIEALDGQIEPETLEAMNRILPLEYLLPKADTTLGFEDMWSLAIWWLP